MHRLPVRFGAGAGLLTGTVAWLSGLGGRECIMRMAVAAVLFFVVGLLLRGSLQKIAMEVDLRRAEAMAAEEAEKKKTETPESGAKELGVNFDRKVEADLEAEGFSPGHVADFIRHELENG